MKTTGTLTRNIILKFGGWAQGRIPTDPDPSFERRGVSGYTFALPGEPDLDRVIYFQPKPGVVQRSHCPAVGVHVTGGMEFTTRGSGGNVEFVRKQRIVRGHPLFRAKVDLAEHCIFSSENSTVVYDGFGVMNPFFLSVEGKGRSLRRRFYADPNKPQNDIEKYDIATLTPFLLNTVFMDSVEMIYAADIFDRTAYRNERKQLLEADLQVVNRKLQKRPNDRSLRIEQAALEKRIAELKLNNPDNRRTKQAGTQTLVNYPLNATEAFVDGRKIKSLAPWPTTIWFGGWDADALGFLVNGYAHFFWEE